MIWKVIVKYCKLNETYVTLEHKTSVKQHRYICSNNQQYIVWVIFLSCQKSLDIK